MLDMSDTERRGEEERRGPSSILAYSVVTEFIAYSRHTPVFRGRRGDGCQGTQTPTVLFLPPFYRPATPSYPPDAPRGLTHPLSFNKLQFL